jgi:anti-sigma regulatory factor (Ser/Thr protein kinase)
MAMPESPLTQAPEVGPSLAQPAEPPGLLWQEFTTDDVTSLRHAVRDRAAAAGLTGDALYDFVVAVHELVTNAVRHGGGRGHLLLRRDGDTLVCDVVDRGDGFAHGVPVGGPPPAADTPGGRGILLANQLTDTLLISDTPDGVTASVTVCLPADPATDAGPNETGDDRAHS